MIEEGRTCDITKKTYHFVIIHALFLLSDLFFFLIVARKHGKASTVIPNQANTLINWLIASTVKHQIKFILN